MPQVPYSGTQEVAPQDRPLANVHVDTPVAAFGGAVAGAITHMGEVAEGAGKELFARAYAMQQLNQTDIANQGVANYQNDLTQRWVEFTKNQGQDAINKLPGFMDDSEKLRQDYATKMPSPEAAYLFNQESRQARFRTVFSAGNYAREEMKKFGRESSNLRIDSIGDNAAISGGDPAVLNPAVDSARREAGLNAERQGFHPGEPDYDQAVKMGGSSVYSKTVRQVMKTEPLKAQGMLETGVKAGKMTETDAANLAPMVKRAVDQQAARSTGTGILNGTIGDWGEKPVAPGRALDVLAKTSGTGGYNLAGPEDPDGNGHAIGKYGVPSSELPRWLKDAGMPAMSEADFLKDPKAQDQLAQSKFDELQKRAGSFDGAMKIWASGIDTDNRVKTAHKALADSASHSELLQKADSVATKLQPDDAEFGEGVKNHVSLERTRKDTFLRQDEFDNGNVVKDALLGVNSPNGKLPESRVELLADPKVADAYAKMKPKDVRAVDAGLILNAKHQFAYTPENQQVFAKLYGIGNSPDASPAARQELIDSNPESMELPTEQRQVLLKLRAKVFKEGAANPDLTAAMKVMNPILTQVYGIRKDDPDGNYYKFQGALKDALEGYGEGQNKFVRDSDEIKKIGTQLLQNSARDTWHWVSPRAKEFELPGDSKAQQLMMDNFKRTYKRDPSPSEIGDMNHALIQLKFNMLAGGKPKMSVKPNP